MMDKAKRTEILRFMSFGETTLAFEGLQDSRCIIQTKMWRKEPKSARWIGTHHLGERMMVLNPLALFTLQFVRGIFPFQVEITAEWNGARRFHFDVWFDIPAWRERAFLYVTCRDKITGEVLEAPAYPLLNHEDAFPLVASVTFSKDIVSLNPRKSVLAGFSTGKYKTPIQFPLSQFVTPTAGWRLSAIRHGRAPWPGRIPVSPTPVLLWGVPLNSLERASERVAIPEVGTAASGAMGLPAVLVPRALAIHPLSRCIGRNPPEAGGSDTILDGPGRIW
jgi:hypothetical protein